MAAVIRIKRRLDEEPLDTVIINCKKRKTDGIEDKDEISTVFKFSTTLNVQEDNVLKHIKKPTKTKLEDYKTRSIDIQEKLKLQKQIDLKNNRYKVINCRRSLNITNESEEIDETNITILDVELEENKENIENVHDLGYVYDLYYTSSDDFAEIDLNELISIYPLSDELVYGSGHDNGCGNDNYSDDSDSNDENNWRNDYPDESDVESVTEEDMLEAMNKMDLNGENELSSDDGEEGFVYSIDSEACGFEEDVDPTDVNRFGEMYARFKARSKKVDDEESHDIYSDNSDNENYY